MNPYKFGCRNDVHKSEPFIDYRPITGAPEARSTLIEKTAPACRAFRIWERGSITALLPWCVEAEAGRDLRSVWFYWYIQVTF